MTNCITLRMEETVKFFLISLICLISLCTIPSSASDIKRPRFIRVDTNSSIRFQDEDNCDIVLEQFAYASSNFTFCAIRYARPIKLCQLCIDNYEELIFFHDAILQISDREGEKCKEKLLNLDRLQVIERGFEYVSGLWARAKCDLCYQFREGSRDGLSPNTKQVISLNNDTIECINENWNNTLPPQHDPKVCTLCKPLYNELNSFYDQHKDEGFCMDIVDLMNTTRSLWSNRIACCLDRKQPEWLFLVSSGVFTCLPLVFYLGAFIFVTRKEQTVLKQNRLPEHFNVRASTSESMMSPD